MNLASKQLFAGGTWNGKQFYHCCTEDRIRVVKTAENIDLLQRSGADKSLQKTVRKAIASRIKKLHQK